MLDELTAECTDCDRTLDPAEATLVYRTAAGERHAYECECGAVTITVHR